MTRIDFDNWCTENISKLKLELVKKYPKSKKTIENDISNFYMHVIERALPEVKDPKAYLFQYIYNTHHRFFSKIPKPGYIIHSKRIIIELGYEAQDDTYEENAYTLTDLYLDALPNLIKELSLDERILYDLYYVNSNSTRKIAKIINISHLGVSHALKHIRTKLKKGLDSLDKSGL